MSSVICVENLSKLYRLGEVSTGTLSHDLNRWWQRVRGKEDPYLKIGQVNDRTKTKTKAENGKAEKLKSESVSASQPFSVSAFESDYVYALKDINFSVNQGEVLGIIGRNGAGKSTLLKILSRVTAPSSGRIKVKGRIASLLEVGTGFHPELTGRENIYLNGAILGMRRQEISSKLDEIVDFSGCAAYLDTPVKRYSSGMYVRLAFAVAAHLDPEILVVDEVLAVGDAEFQRKCLGKMKSVAGAGRTVIFVSHNLASLARLCTRALLFVDGGLSMNGQPSEVINQYSNERIALPSRWLRNEQNSDLDISLDLIEVSSKEVENIRDCNALEDIQIRIDYTVRKNIPFCQIGIQIINSEDNVVFTSADGDGEYASATTRRKGSYTAKLAIPRNFLIPGNYTLLVAAHHPQRILYDCVDRKVGFQVTSLGALATLDGRLGAITPLLHWTINQHQ
jgi:lipopolysaccharide transport system ATP-binding protein